MFKAIIVTPIVISSIATVTTTPTIKGVLTPGLETPGLEVNLSLCSNGMMMFCPNET